MRYEWKLTAGDPKRPQGFISFHPTRAEAVRAQAAWSIATYIKRIKVD